MSNSNRQPQPQPQPQRQAEDRGNSPVADVLAICPGQNRNDKDQFVRIGVLWRTLTSDNLNGVIETLPLPGMRWTGKVLISFRRES